MLRKEQQGSPLQLPEYAEFFCVTAALFSVCPSRRIDYLANRQTNLVFIALYATISHHCQASWWHNSAKRQIAERPLPHQAANHAIFQKLLQFSSNSTTH